MTRTALTFTLATLTLAACGGGQRPQDSINDIVRAYNEDLVWRRFDAAAAHLPAKERSKRVDEWDERSKDMRVTEFEIVRIDQKGEAHARAQVKVSWYLDSEQILRETSAIETWVKKGQSWMLTEEERLRGHEMPGLAEPIAHVRETHEAASTDKTR